MGFDVAAARKEGYSDSEIADYLAGQNKFDVAGARNEGYSDDEIIGHLATQKRGLIDRAIDAIKPSEPKSVMDGRENAQPANDSGVQVDATGRISTVSDRATDIAVNRALAPKGGEQDVMAEASRMLKGSTSPRIADQEAVTLKPERVQADAVDAAGRAAPSTPMKEYGPGRTVGSDLYEIGRQFTGGAATRAPGMVGSALEWWAPEGTYAEQLGKIAKDYWKEKEKGWEPDLKDRGIIASTLVEGAAQAAPSMMGMAAAAVNPLVGAIGVSTLFGGQQAQETYDKGIAAGLKPEQATQAAYRTGLIEGFGETVADIAGAKLLSGAGKAIWGATKGGVEGVAKAAVSPEWAMRFAKDWTANAIIQSATEYGQGRGEAAVEKAYGIDSQDPHEAGIEGARVALGMSALLGIPGAVSHRNMAQSRAKIGEMLNDPAAPQELRIGAAKFVANDIAGQVGKEKAAQWLGQMSDAITGKVEQPAPSPADILSSPSSDAAIQTFTASVSGDEAIPNAQEILAEAAPTGLISQSNTIGATQGQSPAYVNPGASYDASAIPLTAPATPLQESAPAPVTPSEAANARSIEPVHGGLDTLRAESGNSEPVRSDATGLLGHDDRPTAGERVARTGSAAEPVSSTGQNQPVSDGGNGAVERYQWMRNKEGGQGYGNQQQIMPLNERLYDQYVRDKVAGNLDFASYRAQYPDVSHVSLISLDRGKSWKADGIGNADELRPANSQWVKPVASFDSADAIAHGQTADSEVSQPTKEQSNAQAPQAVAPQAQQPAQEPAQVAPAADAIRPLINQLTNLKKTVDEIKYQTGISVKAFTALIEKAKNGTGKASDFTKMAGRFKGKDANINMALLSLADALKPAQTVKKAQKPSSDLLMRIKQLGGISSTHALDVTGEARAPGAWRFAFKKGGRGLDDLAISLAGEGFNIDLNSPHDNGGVRQLADMIKAHIGGERNFKAVTQEAQAAGMLNSREHDAMVEHAEALGIKWQGLSQQQLEDAIYEAEDAIAMAKLDAADNPEAAAEVSDAVVDGFADEADLEFTPSTPDAVAEWMGASDEQGRNQEEVSGAIQEGSETRSGSDSRTAQEAQGTEGEVQRPEYALESHTNAEVAQRERAQAEQEAAKRADEAQAKKDQAAKDKADLEARTKAHAENPDNFQFGESSKDAVKPMGDIFGQPAQPTAEKLPGTQAVAQRQVNAVNKFIDSVVEQFGLTRDEAGRAWDYYVKNKLVKVDAIGGQYNLKDGRLWDGDAMRKAAGIEPAAESKPARTDQIGSSAEQSSLDKYLAETPEDRSKLSVVVTFKNADGKEVRGSLASQIETRFNDGYRVVLTKSGPAFVNEKMQGHNERDISPAGMRYANWLSSNENNHVAETNFGSNPSDPKQSALDTVKKSEDISTADKIKLASEIRQGNVTQEDVAAIVGEPAEAAQAEQPAEVKPQGALHTHKDVMQRAYDGQISTEEFKAAFDALLKNKSGIVSELEAMTKAEIFKQFPGLEYRYKNEKKDRLIDAAYRSMLDDFVLGDSISYSMGQKYEDVIRGYVDRTTDESLSEFADKIRKGREEREAHRKDALAGMENPQTLDDYKRILAAKAQELGEGATFSEARMAMTPEQRAKFDELAAEKSRDERRARADQQKTEVRVAAQTTTGQVIETKHTKTGEPLFVVKAAERVERDIYNQWNATAKRLGGWYSSFNGRGAVPGFQFKARENADAFLQYLGGNVEQAKQVAEERRNAFADDKSQTAVERLNEMASNLEEKADASLNQERKANTARRARFAAAAEAEASHDKAMAITMRNIASAIESGTAKFLDRVRQKVQVEMLSGFVRTAQDDMHRKLYPTYAEQERHKGEKPTPEVADYATFPNYTAFRSDLASLGRALLEVEGTVKLGQRLMKVADDVTDAYLAFAKENLHKVSRFSVKDSSAPAVFPSKTEAEAVIARSGFNGKAIVLPFKRGQNIIILSPSEAMKHGIWQGDNDKRITLSADFGVELVEGIGKAARRGKKISVPWQFENAYDKRKRLEAMGIETPAELRAALREFINLKEAPKEADKIKQMERAMIGRRNDGLDFFPTPDSVADEMVEAADIKEGMSVLEPSAGMGHIAERIREAGVDPDVVELSGDRRELLEAKGFRLVGHDFMDMNPRGFTYGDVFRDKDGVEGIMRGSGGMGSDRVGFIPLGKDERQSEWRDRDELTGVRKNGHNSGYDRILMNPPFSDGRAAQHVQHAYELLKSGGRLVAIVDEGVFFRQDKKTQAFRDWLEQVGATDEKLAEGTFLDPSLPVNTGVAARMLVIDKAETGLTSLSLSPRVNAGFVDFATADAVVRRVVAAKKVWNVEIGTFATFDALPSDVQKATIKDYGEKDAKNAKGIVHDGKVYIVAENNESEADVESTVLHEVEGHIGIRRLYGKEIVQKLNTLYVAIGGLKGLKQIVAQRGIAEDIGGYALALNENERLTDEQKLSVMMDEVLAHYAQHPRFSDRIKAIVGMIRAWLRENGFAKLAEYGETDLLHILQQGRAQLKMNKDATGGVTSLMVAWHGIPTFYSQLRKAMRDAPDRVFSTGKQTAAWLQANAAKLGIKKDEMYWSGVTDWLNTQGKVSKADVLAYLDGNGVQVQDVMLGGVPTDWTAKKGKLGWEVIDADGYEVGIAHSATNETEAIKEIAERSGTEADTKFATYQLPGGENYRELLLTLPENAASVDESGWETRYDKIPNIEKLRAEGFNPPEGGYRLYINGELYTSGFHKTAEAAINEARRANKEIAKEKSNFHSGHFDQPNILAHVRFNERTDAEGNKVLFIEEIQSDWGQKGKKEGFTKPANPELVKRIAALFPDGPGARGMSPRGVPEAPFVTDTKSWTALALKRMIAYAAENGFDRIAWTTGEQQAARYDLSKQVDSLLYKKNPDGTYRVSAQIQGRGQMIGESINESDLEDYVGKDVAKKMADGAGKRTEVQGKYDPISMTSSKDYMQELSGLDLKVGGEGMKGFYDAIVPQVANDILKKMGGGKVDEVNVPRLTRDEIAGRIYNEAYKDLPQSAKDSVEKMIAEAPRQPGFTLTPELRAKVLNEGLPMFSKRQANATGMTVAQVRAIVAPIAAKWTHGKLEIVQDASEVPEFAAAAADGGGAIEGAYLGNGRIYLVANSLQTEDRVLQVLAHEAIGHLAAEELLDSGEYRAALKAVQLMDKTGNKIVRRLAEEVDSLQPGLSADRRAKEILAKAVETGEYKNNATLKRIIGDIVTWLKARLRDMGFNGKWLGNMSEVEAFAALDKVALSSMRKADARLNGKASAQEPRSLLGLIPNSAPVRGSSYNVLSQSNVVKWERENWGDKPMFSRQQSMPEAEQPPSQPPRQNNLELQGGQAGNNASWDAPEPSTLDSLIYKLQNKHIDMKRVVEAIKSTGAELGEKWNAYLQEELFHGRAAKRTQDFVNTELKPLMVEMQARGLTLAEMDEYLHARHAEEANALIAERDPDMPDGGSGMTNQEAADYFANLPDGKRKQLDAAARRVDAIIAKTRDLYVSYGLVSKNQADEWAAMFQHYVPLMREDHDGGMGIGQGFSIRGKEVKHRTGSTAAVVDIFANIALQREKAIVRGEKNRVAVSLAGMVKLNPNPDFWTFGKVPTERVLNEQTGLVEERADPMFKSRDNVVVAKIKDNKGEVHERAVIFNEHDERAMRMAEAIKNLDATQLGELLATSARITRYFSSINTQYNPVFGVTNLVRDTQGLLLNLSSTPIAKHRAEVLKNIPSALKGIYADTRAERKGHPATSKWAQLWEELQDEGGMTGYRDLYRTSEDRAKAIEHELDPHNWVNSKWGKVFTAGGMLKVPMTTAQDIAAPIFDWLSDYNLTMEGATRLSAYKVAIEQGMSKQAAASLAKNITVNFNRKGQMGQQAGALYAFFNAAMQGTARISETVFTMDKGDIKTLRLSKTGKTIVAGGVMLGAMQALALAAAGFDDDEPPEFLRERNLIIPIGGKKYISIPMPLGFHAIPNIGRITTEWAMHGFKHPVDHAIRLISVFTDAFNPIGSSGISMQTIAPTALDPFAALAENKDWTGKPIAKEDFNSMNPTPGFARNKDTATYLSKMIAEAINTLSGGTKYTPGMASPTADQIDYLFGQVTGGVGRELGKAEQTVMAAITGDELPTYKIPLVGRFYGDSETQSSQSNAFYANLKKINEVEAEIKGRLKDRQPVDEYKAENPEYRLIMRANYAEKIVSGLRKQKREQIEKDAPRERIKAIEDRITNEMKKLNEAVRMLREKEAA